MAEIIEILILPFIACLILTGIHCYLGLHVIERQVLFVDLALAQIAVLGTSVGIFLGVDPDNSANYWLSLGFTVIGATIFALSRFRKERIPQEAIIGIVYVVASAMVFVFLSFSGEGLGHVRESMIGDILLVSSRDIIKIAIIYAAVGLIHYIFRERFYQITDSPDEAFDQGVNVRGWDFLFYVLFGIVVTSSVKIAGVLLVFSYLVIPAVCAMVIASSFRRRLIIGWIVGTIGSLIGMGFSYGADLPTGASIVCVFGLILIVLILIKMILRGEAVTKP